MKRRIISLVTVLMMALPLFSAPAAAGFTASEWAREELAEADRLALIPDSLKNADLTEAITRASFAAVSTKVYEALSGAVLETPAEVPTFADTGDTEVLKAYHAGITNGAGVDGYGRPVFAPNEPISREALATMLTRAYKKATFEGWSLPRDAEFDERFNASFTMPAPFADDAAISDWARPSVSFMAANGIVGGVGGNLFAPRPTTEGETAAGYGQATIEQALAMAVRMVKRFKAGAPQIGSDTDAAIRAVLRDKYRSEAPDGLLHVQSYRLLAVETVSGTPKAGMTGHVTIETVYLIVCHMKYRVNEKPEEVEDGIVPAAVTFSIDENGAYALKEYWTPGAGAAYKGDIQAKFPAAAADEALRIEQYAGALKEDAREQAAEYLAGLIQ